MAYRRSSSRRGGSASRGRRVSGYTRGRSTSRVSRRAPARRRSSSAGSRTVRLVIEQAAPSVAAVSTPEGYKVPDTSVPRRAKF